MGTEDNQPDLELEAVDAEKVVGGVKKHAVNKRAPNAPLTAPAAVALTGSPPSPLAPEPIESYMVGSPEADQ
jgi:hypothetical protein